MVQLADHHLARAGLHLRMTFQTQVVVSFQQQFLVDRAMRTMTRRAALAQRFVFEGEWPGLLAMTLGAGLIQLSHRQPAGWLPDVAPVRVVTIDTIDSIFHDRMVVRQLELRLNFEVALITTRRVFSGIHDELSPTASHGDVLAARPVARFAAGHAGPFQLVLVKSAMRAGVENSCDVRVAIRARFVSDKHRSLDIRRRDHGAVHRGTGTEDQTGDSENRQRHRRAQAPGAFVFPVRGRLHAFEEEGIGCGCLNQGARESIPQLELVP